MPPPTGCPLSRALGPLWRWWARDGVVVIEHRDGAWLEMDSARALAMTEADAAVVAAAVQAASSAWPPRRLRVVFDAPGHARADPWD